jgi:hypothetical protein
MNEILKALFDRKVAIAFSFMVVGPIVYMLLDRELPYTITGGVTAPPQIQRGKPYRIEWSVKNGPKDCPGTAYRFARDAAGKIWTIKPVETGFSYIPYDANHPDLEIAGYPRTLDPDTALGTIEFFGTNIFHCNILQWVWPIEQIYPIVKSVVID